MDVYLFKTPDDLKFKKEQINLSFRSGDADFDEGKHNILY
jgi:hypothetical protein